MLDVDVAFDERLIPVTEPWGVSRFNLEAMTEIIRIHWRLVVGMFPSQLRAGGKILEYNKFVIHALEVESWTKTGVVLINDETEALHID